MKDTANQQVLLYSTNLYILVHKMRLKVIVGYEMARTKLKIY